MGRLAPVVDVRPGLTPRHSRHRRTRAHRENRGASSAGVRLRAAVLRWATRVVLAFVCAFFPKFGLFLFTFSSFFDGKVHYTISLLSVCICVHVCVLKYVRSMMGETIPNLTNSKSNTFGFELVQLSDNKTSNSCNTSGLELVQLSDNTTTVITHGHLNFKAYDSVACQDYTQHILN